MAKKFNRKFKDGDPWEPWMASYVFAELERWRNAVSVPPLMIDDLESESPPSFWVMPVSGGRQLAVTASIITAAVEDAGSCTDSGTLLKTTPGTGTVYPMAYNGTCLVADSSKGTISVLSFSTTTGGIPEGTSVWITMNDNDGQWYATSVNCGN